MARPLFCVVALLLAGLLRLIAVVLIGLIFPLRSRLLILLISISVWPLLCLARLSGFVRLIGLAALIGGLVHDLLPYVFDFVALVNGDEVSQFPPRARKNRARFVRKRTARSLICR